MIRDIIYGSSSIIKYDISKQDISQAFLTGLVKSPGQKYVN